MRALLARCSIRLLRAEASVWAEDPSALFARPPSNRTNISAAKSMSVNGRLHKLLTHCAPADAALRESYGPEQPERAVKQWSSSRRIISKRTKGE